MSKRAPNGRWSPKPLAPLVGVWLALASVAGCQDEAVSPSPSGAAAGGAGAGGAAGGGGEGAGGDDPGPRVREVFFRNPMGSPPDNLFVDGDFELSIVPEGNAGGQYGFVAFSPNGGPVALLGETGGLCRSGLRCGRLRSGRLLFGRGAAAPDDADMRASIWVKPLEAAPDPERPCELGTFVVIGCDTFQQLDSLDEADAPDAQGWCQMSAELDGERQSVCLYVEADVEMLVDNATLLPVADGDLDPLPPPRHPAPALRSDQLARMANLREVLRRRTPFGKPRPDGQP